ncbi:hypothetical protein ACH46N_27250 [Streptomyces pristinaespiralis]|jgi:hypothetical protein|uniref:Uncharacterized protein n=2 Tax=Streptomyces pristinaespiralis TaxID=38300 RepID=B5H4U3_STRE2|nr:hypothetical protein [Streptomyces pristinaespiralis]ALC21201.1 putative membrane protein [Streptomyces pristinaespiralis]EDY61854.1 conserved hypothetical protein [Streptomyces pristinaespiralis ATCC 25486]QMU16049.1 hypothetical protein H3L99_22550 [Streptomyces pristinaespiralis]
MKYSKAAAIIAGSVAALGAASPAFAAGSAGMPPMSLNGGVAELVTALPEMESVEAGSAVNQVADSATELNNVKGDAPEQVLKTAGSLTPMLGGVSLGG